MRRGSLLTPIGMMVATGVFVVLIFLQPNTGSRAAPFDDISDYPPPTQTAIAAATETAIAKENGVYPEPSTAPTATTGPAAPVPAQATRTSTATRTPTLTPRPNDFSQTTATPPTAVNSNAAVTATVETTPTMTPDANTRACAPGETVTISGEGPANAGFLVYFGERVVSGGTVRRDGRFEIGLIVGNEREGNYPVEVRVRGTRTVLAKFTCQVPATTPTPIATRTP